MYREGKGTHFTVEFNTKWNMTGELADDWTSDMGNETC